MNKEGETPERFKHHTFIGSAFPGPVLVPAADHSTLTAWGRWLIAEGFPAMSEFPIKRQGPKKNSEFFELPWRKPPSTAAQANEAKAYFASMIEPREVRYAAQ